jgi:hypothetical protein
MSWLTVQTDELPSLEEEQAQDKRIEKAISSLKGVSQVDVEGDDAKYLLEAIGARLWKLEDMSSLDCPLREMRQEIEGLLRTEFRNYTPKVLSETLTPECDWCAEHRG